MVMQRNINELIHKDLIDIKRCYFLSLETPIYTGIGLEKIIKYFQFITWSQTK